MSQFFIGTTSGNLPPSVPTSFVTDINSPSIPIANIENVIGGETTANTTHGIRTDGSSGSNTLTVQLTNRISGTITTSDATVTTINTFVLPSTGTYAFDFNIAAYNLTDVLGAAYSVFVGVRSSGGVAFKLNLEDKIVNEEGGMAACNVTAAVSGNSILIQVQGIAGKTIDWNSIGTYVFIG